MPVTQQPVAPDKPAEPQAAESAPAADPGIGIVTSALARPVAQALMENIDPSASSAGPRMTVMEANDAFKALCNSADLVLASRRILESELIRCRNLGSEIVEWKLGYQAVVLTAGPTAEPAHLSPREVYLALARRIPDPADPSRLIDNPNTTWHDVDSRLDGRTIDVLAPADALVRDVFVQLVMAAGCDTYPALNQLKQLNRSRYAEACHQVRNDGHYHEVRLSPTFVTQQLWAEPNWVALLPYSFYDIYRRQLLGTMLAGAEPTLASLEDGSYPAARPVYAYAQSNRLNRNPAMRSLTLELSGGYVLGRFNYMQRSGLFQPDASQRQRPDFRPPAPLKPESLSPAQERDQ
jgi:phosphate transport system substrate-binding protein